jgi:hypothetical protein
MARIENPLGITGTFGGISIYKMNGKFYARVKGGPKREDIKKSPKMVKIRENNEEFGRAAKAAKTLHLAVIRSMFGPSDRMWNGKLTQAMLKIIKSDTVNKSGNRTITEGLRNPDGKAVMKAVNFNSKALLNNVLLAPVSVNKQNNSIHIKKFVPSKCLAIPAGATHFSISAAVGSIDFPAVRFNLVPTNVVSAPLVSSLIPVSLVPLSVIKSSDFTFFVLKIAFFKVKKNVWTSLNNGTNDTLAVIEVI